MVSWQENSYQDPLAAPSGQPDTLQAALSEQERAFYMSIYRTVNPQEKAEMDAQPLVQFLLSSGL